jgi:hypothetical protein
MEYSARPQSVEQEGGIPVNPPSQNLFKGKLIKGELNKVQPIPVINRYKITIPRIIYKKMEAFFKTLCTATNFRFSFPSKSISLEFDSDYDTYIKIHKEVIKQRGK